MSNYIKGKNIFKFKSYKNKGGIIVKICSFSIEKLHGIYNYQIDFHEDVTFLYGSNGCGKTTILNMITHIITGQIFKLFDYSFDKIELDYYENDNIKKIIIDRTDINSLKVFYNDKVNNLKRRDIRGEYIIDNEGAMRRDLVEFYYKTFSWLKDIKDSFNFVFLPLSRNNNQNSIYDKEPFQDTFNLYPIEHRKSNNHEYSLNYIRSMISENYTKISSKINEINDDLRIKIYKSFFHFDTNDNFKTYLFNEIIENDDFLKSKTKLLKTFRDLDILTKDFENDINSFYSKWKKYVDNYTDHVDDKLTSKTYIDTLSFIISNYTKIQQILEITKLADEIDSLKEKELAPINRFLRLINNFFKQGECSKELKIDAAGKIYFITPYCSDPIEIENLSSGEQQLLIFFTYLVFGLKERGQGIFIVDEPELSLHLAWQRKYVESILSINSEVQLIFATHSPEILSKYRDRRVRLNPKFYNQNLFGGQEDGR